MLGQHRTIGGSLAWVVAAAFLISGARAYAQKKPGPSKPLPTIRYSLQFIGNSAIQPFGGVRSITDHGEVVGNAFFAEDSSIGPYLYQADLNAMVRLEELTVNRDIEDALGRIHRRSLNEPYGANVMGAYINNAGQVATSAVVVVTDPETGSSTYYREGCRLSPDPHPDGGVSYWYESLGTIEPLAINDDGAVAGWDGESVVVSRTPGSLETIGSFKSDYTRASAISNANSEGDFHIAGSTSNSGGWIWHPDGTWTQPTWSNGRANFVNGLAVSAQGALLATGSARMSRRSANAFRYTEGGTMEDLGSPTGYSSYGNGINSRGRVVGHYNNFDGERAFLYYDNTSGMTNLDKLIAEFATADDRNAWMSTSTRTSAVGINTTDAISGQGTFNGVYRAFVLIPVP